MINDPVLDDETIWIKDEDAWSVSVGRVALKIAAVKTFQNAGKSRCSHRPGTLAFLVQRKRPLQASGAFACFLPRPDTLQRLADQPAAIACLLLAARLDASGGRFT